jgi:Rrf2 family protein
LTEECAVAPVQFVFGRYLRVVASFRQPALGIESKPITLFHKEQQPSLLAGCDHFMRLTRASSYALHAVAFMAAQKQNKPVASHAVAEARGIPERFLLKVLKPLVSARILHSIKGPNGGYRLARAASDISLLEVVEAVDGPIRGQAPLSEMANGSLLDKKLEAICDQTAELLRKQLHKVRMTELASKS